ncbi:MAG: hypothetical protein V3U84_08045 [Thiotrichaceae bacterium]
MSIEQYVKPKVESNDAWVFEWCCPTLICTDLEHRLSSHQPHSITRESVLELAAISVNLVSYFEKDFGYVDFVLSPNDPIENWFEVPVRVALDLTPKPVAIISLSPAAEETVASEVKYA